MPRRPAPVPTSTPTWTSNNRPPTGSRRQASNPAATTPRTNSWHSSPACSPAGQSIETVRYAASRSNRPRRRSHFGGQRGTAAVSAYLHVDAQPRVVGKVGAELDEERPEVGVHAVEVEVVDLHRGAGQPQVAGPGHRVATLLRAEHRRLLLRATDEQDTLPVLT